MPNEEKISRLRENLPKELQQANQWVVWRMEERPSGLTKVPYNAREYLRCRKEGEEPRNLKADTTDPHDWSTFNEALEAFATGDFDGVGHYVNNHIGIDIDRCGTKGMERKISGVVFEVQQVIKAVNSYTEFSPSGIGIRIICKRTQELSEFLSKYTMKQGTYEIYQAKFLTFTGDRVEKVSDTPITREVAGNEDGIKHYVTTFQKPRFTPTIPKPEHSDSIDDDIFEKMQTHNPYLFRIMSGDYTQAKNKKDNGDPDWSSYIHAFCIFVCGFTQDEDRITKILESTRFYQESTWCNGRWEKRKTKEIANALPKAISQTPAEDNTAPYDPTKLPKVEEKLLPAEIKDEFQEQLEKECEEIKQKAQEYEDTLLLDWDTFSQLADEEYEDWFIEGLLAAGTLGIITGLPYSGKSTFAYALISSLVLAIPFFGRPSQQVPVILINADKMLKRIIKKKILANAPEDVATFKDLFFYNDKFDGTVSELEKMIKRVEQKTGFKKGLVLIDTLRSAFLVNEEGQSENDAVVMTKILKPLREFCRTSGWTCETLHHNNRGSNTYSGSSAIEANTDQSWNVTREGDKATLTIKDRYDSNFSLVWKLEDGKIVESKATTKKESKHLEFIMMFPTIAPNAWTVEEVIEQTQLCDKTARKKLKECEQGGYAPRLEKLGNGSKSDPYRWYRV